MDIVLRKRLCVNIYKPTFTNKLMRSISLRRGDQVEATGVVYEVVSNIPKVSRRVILLTVGEGLAGCALNDC